FPIFKLLTPTRRRKIGNKIKETYKHYIEVSSPQEIDESTNLNYLEAIKTAKIINKLTENLSKTIKVIVDCPSVNIQAWSNDVQLLLKKPEIIQLSCEHKADANHPIVSAASIIAKERREDEIHKLRLELRKDFGSGYPADPKTKEFIAENFNKEKYKHIIRFSWKTVKKLIAEKESSQKKLF
ncbi:MAG: ribonuclease HII, partial [Nanoarchaeota archaeon]|nr:ribonuclease HII [Nanoarchaeota archaeon]